MNIHKNKRIKVISDDSLKHLHSSLNVNLSCASNLTDSGNESLKQTDIEYINNASECSNSNQTLANHKSVSYDIPLKNANIILEKISHNDLILNKHCEKLKYAILTKTKQMFDKQDELSVKTCTVLNTKGNQSSTNVNKNIKHTIEEQNISAMSGNTDKINFENKGVNMNQSINSIPKNKYKSKSIEKQKKQKKLKKRCLFITKEQSCDISINNSNINSKSFLSQSKGKYHTEGDKIAEINKNPCTLNVTLDTLCKSISSSKARNHGTDNFITSKDQSLSISNIVEHETTFTATPIACSTMIDGNARMSGTEDEVYFQAKTSDSNVHAKRDITSMEITEVCGGFILCDKPQAFVKCITQNASKNCSQKRISSDCVSVSVKQTSLQINSNNKESLNETSKRSIQATTINKDTEQNTNMQWNNTSTETDSANTVQTSLNVNTSMDLLNQSNRSIDKCTEKRERKTCKNFRNAYEEGTHLAASEKVQESINTICTSLQMNTLLNTSSMLQENNCINKVSEMKNIENQRKDMRENGANTINMYRTKDTNLTKNFEDILTSRNISNYFNNQSTKSKEKDKINNTTINNQNKQVIEKITHSNEQSYIEVTPYPMCRSVMLRSQLKQNAVAHSLQNNSQFNNSENKQKSSTDIHLKAKSCFLEQEMPVVSINLSKRQEEIKNNTITLNNSSYERSSMQTQTSVVIKAINTENKIEENINAQKVDKKKSKKKLMPLRECSQLSFSPIEEQYSPPRCLIFRKKIKKKDKCNKVNVNNVQCNKREKKKDYNEEKTQKKKPRKVISKKIIIKKIVNQDILRKLEKSRENLNKTQVNMHSLNTNSSNDFQSLKEPSTTQSTKKKAHRINIVTTGLSNEDKSMVKSVVKALGSAKIEPNVTKRTTHVVTTGVRTINLLHGIIRGCWLVNLEWVLKSLENNGWLNPEEYEMTHFSKAVLENRKDRQLFGSSYVPELFATCGYIYIEKNTTPPCNVLKDLIKAAGGCITENPEVAKVVIGTESLKETWVLDCITSGELQPYNQYQQY